ncbi:MAG: alpha/beta fold hydrolase [Pseudomonadota bacterium]
MIKTTLAAIVMTASGFAWAQSEAPVDAEPTEIVDDSLTDIALDIVEDEPFFNDTVSDPISVVCPFKADIGYSPGEVTCAFIEVPENREDPNSRTIRLLFAKIHAQTSLEDYEAEDGEDLQYKDDPVAYLTGGPGVSIQSYVQRFLDHDLVKERDLYVLQQRGIAESGDFCPFYSAVRRELEVGTTTYESELQFAERLKECFRSASARGVDVTAYNTVENARDVRALRQALGFDAWNVWGISYGSHLGQMLTQVDPEGIKGLVIDAIVPNDLGGLQQIYRHIDRGFGKVFDRCAETNNPHCKGLEERLAAIVEEEPLTLKTNDAEIFPSGEIVVGGEVAGFVAFFLLYEQSQHPAIPAAMDQALEFFEDQDAELMGNIAAMASGGPFGGLSQGMSQAIQCNDGYSSQAAAEAEEDAASFPIYAGRLNTPEGLAAIAQACVDAGLPLKDRADYQLVRTNIPTLIINGDWDPVTPPPLADRIVPGFSNSRYVVVPYAGHGPTRSMSECSGQVLGDFFDDPTQDLSSLDMTCFEEGEEPPEYLTYLTSKAPIRAASLIATDKHQALILPGGIAGLAALSSLLSLILMPTGFVARRLAGSGAAGLAPGDTVTRSIAFATALLTVGGLGLIGAGATVAADTMPASLAIGVAQPGVFGAWLIVLGGVSGLVLAIRTLMVRLREPMRTGTFVGFLLTGLSSTALVILMSGWDLLPF